MIEPSLEDELLELNEREARRRRRRARPFATAAALAASATVLAALWILVYLIARAALELGDAAWSLLAAA